MKNTLDYVALFVLLLISGLVIGITTVFAMFGMLDLEGGLFGYGLFGMIAMCCLMVLRDMSAHKNEES